MKQLPEQQFKEKKGRRDRRNGSNEFEKKSEFEQQVLDIARVTRVTKGGKRFSFRASVVIGDRKNSVGMGVAKGRDVSQSIQKAVHQAKKQMVKVPVKDQTIPYQVRAKFKSAQVILKPGIYQVSVANANGSSNITYFKVNEN